MKKTSIKGFARLSPTERAAKYLRKRTLSQNFKLRLLGEQVGDEFGWFNDSFIKAIKTNTVEGWLNFSSNPGANEFEYGLAYKLGWVEAKQDPNRLYVTQTAVDWLNNTDNKASLFNRGNY